MTALYYYVPMKKIIGTMVLFVLFLLTTFALNHVGFPRTSTLTSATKETGTIHK
jgi:hypothetical protein